MEGEEWGRVRKSFDLQSLCVPNSFTTFFSLFWRNFSISRNWIYGDRWTTNGEGSRVSRKAATVPPRNLESELEKMFQFLLSFAFFFRSPLTYTVEKSHRAIILRRLYIDRFYAVLRTTLQSQPYPHPAQSENSKQLFAIEKSMNKWTWGEGNGGRIAWILLQSTSGLVNWMKIFKQLCAKRFSFEGKIEIYLNEQLENRFEKN